MPVTVHFATNRSPSGAADPAKAYGFAPLPPGRLIFGSAEVTDADLATLSAGTLQSLGPTSDNAFSPADAQAIRDAGKNLLIFVHGFANSFNDGIIRAAFNAQFFAASAIAAADTSVIAFSWPSEGDVVAPGDFPGLIEAPLSILMWCFGRLENPLCHAYEQDRDRAKACGPALGGFFDAIAPLLQEARADGRRVTLLAHSMGNVVLSRGIEALRERAARVPLFDEIILAASDADWAQDDAGTLPPDWLRALPAFATRTSVYFSHNDEIVRLSANIVDQQRMGTAGPAAIDDATQLPDGAFRFVNCAEVPDHEPGKTIDSCHQYYRRLKPVRDDIAGAMAGYASARMIKL